MPQVSDFISGLLANRDKHIEVEDRHHVMTKHKGQVQIKMCDNNRDTFIATFHNVLWYQIYATGYNSLLS